MIKKENKIRNNIRSYMRTIRKSLSIQEQYELSKKVALMAFNLNIINSSKNIGVFLSFDGEINTYPLILNLWLKNKRTFLPVISSFYERKLLFVYFDSNSILFLNKFKILEPSLKIEKAISIYNLDTIIVPLVAFDVNGTRLGMGGGFYDSFLQNWKKEIIPIGLSYDFQLVNYIPKQLWDVSLPIFLTPNKIWII